MPRTLPEQVLDFIRERQLVRAGDRVAVAVSGGADSVALLRLLLDLRAELGIVLTVAHLDHRLRGDASTADAAFVATLAAEHRLEFHSAAEDVAGYAGEHQLSVEAAGRRLRYAFFARLLADGKATCVATAHTAEDQAETVLLRLIRGAGPRGLAGIHLTRRVACAAAAAASPGAIVRPLLATGRQQLREYLAGLGQPWREDPTNQDTAFARNRVRYELLPLLQRQYNPGIVRVLSEAAEVAAAEEEFWRGHLERLLPTVAVSPGGVRLDALAAQPLAIRRRLVRALAERLGAHLDFEHTEQLLRLAAVSGRRVRQVPLPGGWRARVEGGELRLERAAAGPAAAVADYEYRLPVPGEVRIVETGRLLRAMVVAGDERARGYNPGQFLDPGSLQPELRVRNWRPGDRFWPLHSRAPRKLKEWLQERHVPAPERSAWPVALSAGEVVWVRGFPVSRRHHAAGAGQVVVLEEVPL